MPPEQMDGCGTDARSDQFSFCVTLYEAVYGERPFPGETLTALMVSMTASKVRSAPEGNTAPAKLREALLRGLASDPQERWPSMDALLAELQRTVSAVERTEVTHLRRHVDLRIGVRARVLTSFAVGVLQLVSGVCAHLVGLQTGQTPGYRFMAALCSLSSLLVIGFVLYATRGRLFGPHRRPMGLVSRTQMSMVVAIAVAMPAMPAFGYALGLPIQAVAAFALLTFGLIVGAMAAFLPKMLVSAGVFIACAVATVVWPERLWLWWAVSGGFGILLMAWAWHGLRRDPDPEPGWNQRKAAP